MGYDVQIIHETERLLFRQHIMPDTEPYCAMEQDPEVRRYVGGAPRLRQDAENRFMRELQPIVNKLGMWAIIFKPEACYVGRCGLYPHFKPEGGVYEGEASLGFYIAHPYWGRGFATEAAEGFIRFGFDELKLNRIVTIIDARNSASVHIIEKLGFTLVNTETGHRIFYHFALQNPNHAN